MYFTSLNPITFLVCRSKDTLTTDTLSKENPEMGIKLNEDTSSVTGELLLNPSAYQVPSQTSGMQVHS